MFHAGRLSVGTFRRSHCRGGRGGAMGFDRTFRGLLLGDTGRERVWGGRVDGSGDGSGAASRTCSRGYEQDSDGPEGATTRARYQQKRLRWKPRWRMAQEESTGGLLRVSCQIVSGESFSTTIMGVAHSGHRKTAGLRFELSGAERWGWGASCARRRQRGRSLPRRRLARNPKERMRTKPRGRTCKRNRRRNSGPDSVMILFLFPWA